MRDAIHKNSYRSSRFYALALTGWVALSVLASYVALETSINDSEREFRHEVAEAVMELRQKLQANESVLSGFSAFLFAVPGDDRSATTRYAGAAATPYPHVYMLEVAREVPVADVTRFTATMRQHWQANFSLRDFAYQGARRWQEVKPKASYWPLVFMYPDSNAVQALYGLDIDSVPLLSQGLRDAWQSQSQSVTRPFRLFEGDLAYIIFQSVPRPVARMAGDSMTPLGGALIAMLVVKAEMLRPSGLDKRDQVRAEFVLPLAGPGDAAVGLPASDVPPLFTQDAAPAHRLDALLPLLTQEMVTAVGPQAIRLSFSRQLGWKDLSGSALRAVALISLLSLALVMLYLRRHYLAMKEAESEHARADFLAMHDPLTELPNRHLLADRVRQALLRWQRGGVQFALFLIDLDHFKEINDTQGHEGGDHVLKVVSHRISSTLRATDTVARYGGDEFIVLIADVLGESEARSVGEKLLTVVAEPILFGEVRLRVTASLGVALCPRDGIDFESLCHQADLAMYKVKQEGRNGLSSESLAAVASVG